MPTVLITGTPGTGKSTLSKLVSSHFPQMKLLEVGELAKEKRCFDGWDEQRQCHILDEDKLLDIMEELGAIKSHRAIVDYHSSELFPERWIDAVFVLRTDTNILYTRLESRGYSCEKVKENVEAEIFQVLFEEATDAFPAISVVELTNNDNADLEKNADQIVQWINKNT